MKKLLPLAAVVGLFVAGCGGGGSTTIVQRVVGPAKQTPAQMLHADRMAMADAIAAQFGIESWATDHVGSYKGITSADVKQRLFESQPSITLTYPDTLQVSAPSVSTYTASVRSTTGDVYSISRDAAGHFIKTCGGPSCPAPRW